MYYGSLFVADWHNTKPSNLDLQDTRINARLTASQAAELAGIHRTSYTRQESGQTKASLSIYRLFQCYAGHLAHPTWQGWKFKNGFLVSPEGQDFVPGDLYQSHWLHQSVRTLRAELRRYTGRDFEQDHWHGYRFKEKRQA